MKHLLKKIVLSIPLLTNVANFFNKLYLKRKHAIRYGKNVFIGFSVDCEGKNNFASNSSITSSTIGYGSYLAEGTTISKTRIGRYSSIGPNVQCIFGKHPASTFVSTHPAFFSLRHQGLSHTKIQRFKEFANSHDSKGKYSITIGNDVWIGANVSIMDGVVIGDGAIIAANALVNRDVAPYTIVGGVPAKYIKNRFTDEQIEFLSSFKWWDKPEKWITENASDFTDINEFYKKFIHVRN
jgi:acetyltransferase-like isoleucine patch superfamily enzyme